MDTTALFCIIKTVETPQILRESRGQNMAYQITDACIACGACADQCPAEAISEGDIYVIDADACVDCGSCADQCPMGAIEEA